MSNGARVLKTLKQTSPDELSYMEAAELVISQEGIYIIATVFLIFDFSLFFFFFFLFLFVSCFLLPSSFGDPNLTSFLHVQCA